MNIQLPSSKYFQTWPDFYQHLDSMEEVAKEFERLGL